MSFAKIYSAQTTLLTAEIIEIEIDLARGLHAFAIVGLPDKAVEESRDRVSAAIKNTGYTSPKSKNEKVVISLAPANLKKEGPVFDVGIALAYLLSTKEINFDPTKKLFLGELSLNGELRPIKGTLPIVTYAKEKGFKEIYLPYQNAKEGALIEGVVVYGARTLKELISHLNTKESAGKRKSDGEEEKEKIPPQEKTKIIYREQKGSVNIGDVRGQETAKRGLLIAASGGHNVALYGPPGTGKTMLARAFSHILPPLSFPEILEVTSIHSVNTTLDDTLITTPPFRSPHHTASYVSVIGGGTTPKPGEVTLAHRGVLFLDEFPEFDRRVIESLREPLEEREVTISRAKGSAQFPARFILIAAFNPCPCGNLGSQKQCVCSPIQLERYRKKISGPIIDRIDMWIEVAHIDHQKLSEKQTKDSTKELKKQIKEARGRQQKRFEQKGISMLNSDMNVKDIDTLVYLTDNIRTLLNTAALKLDLSPRAYHRVIKLARTIADIEESGDIKEEHMLEALQYRPRSLFM